MLERNRLRITDTAKCPFCGSDIEPGSQRCGFCGSDLLHNETARTDEEATKQYKCPSCGAPLIFSAENSMLKVTIARYADGYTVRGNFDPRHVKQKLIRTEETKTYIPPAKGAVGGSVRSR